MGNSTSRYRVTGIHPVLGHEPGAEFTARLTSEQEKALIAGGALSHAPSAPAPATKRPAATPDHGR